MKLILTKQQREERDKIIHRQAVDSLRESYDRRAKEQALRNVMMGVWL